MKTKNPSFGIFENMYSDYTQGGNLSTLPTNNSGVGIWCKGCLSHGVYNWLDLIEKKHDKEFYRKCNECKKVKK